MNRNLCFQQQCGKAGISGFPSPAWDAGLFGVIARARHCKRSYEPRATSRAATVAKSLRSGRWLASPNTVERTLEMLGRGLEQNSQALHCMPAGIHGLDHHDKVDPS
jgi:hypothetical protein